MSSVKDKVEKLIRTYGTNDPIKIAEDRNIEIVYENLETVFGYYHYYKRVQVIHINNKLNDVLQRFVCAHELGHAICHPKQNTAYLSKHTLFSTDKLEREANTFAVELLLPDEEIQTYIHYGYTLEQACSLNGIPKQFMKYKILT